MMLMSSPRAICRSRSQQKSVFGCGPARREVPRRGSFEGSGNDARWVGGGDEDAPVRSELLRLGAAEDVFDGVRDSAGDAEGDEFGSATKGFDTGSSMMAVEDWC